MGKYCSLRWGPFFKEGSLYLGNFGDGSHQIYGGPYFYVTPGFLDGFPMNTYIVMCLDAFIHMP